MKPEDRKRLKQHIEMIVEHREPDVIAQENFKKLQDEVADLREKNIKLRLELHALRFKEAQENRFITWVYQVYAKHVADLIYEIETACTYESAEAALKGYYGLPMVCWQTINYLKVHNEHIYDGTYLDIEISADVKKGIPENEPKPSNSDVSVTQDVLTNIETGRSVEKEAQG